MQRRDFSDDKIYFKSNSGDRGAWVSKYKPLGGWTGEWSVRFECLNRIDYDVRGGNGLGMKVYATKEKAIAAAKRYVVAWGD